MVKERGSHMELGQKILQLRETAGLSQRQLCGDMITRNMLSRIEHGTVRPSMTTLAYLAERLGKPVSFFLDEESVTSPNVERMAVARCAFAAGDWSGAVSSMDDYEDGDATFDYEKNFLLVKCYLAMAAQAIEEMRQPYAVELLTKAEQAGKWTPYFGPELKRELAILRSQVDETAVLPVDDRELLTRAKKALAEDNPARAGSYLDAAENQTTEAWNFLRGESYFAYGDFQSAEKCYRLAEGKYPKETAARLEVCYRNMDDYKMAYFYACKQRE